MVTGDLNDEPGSPPVTPLVSSGLENALERITPEAERWTHWYRSANTVAALDYLLLSPALTAATAGQAPVIERRGISFQRTQQNGQTGPGRRAIATTTRSQFRLTLASRASTA